MKRFFAMCMMWLAVVAFAQPAQAAESPPEFDQDVMVMDQTIVTPEVMKIQIQIDDMVFVSVNELGSVPFAPTDKPIYVEPDMANFNSELGINRQHPMDGKEARRLRRKHTRTVAFNSSDRQPDDTKPPEL